MPEVADITETVPLTLRGADVENRAVVRRVSSGYGKVPALSDIYRAREVYDIVPAVAELRGAREYHSSVFGVGAYVYNAFAGKGRAVIVRVVYLQLRVFAQNVQDAARGNLIRMVPFAVDCLAVGDGVLFREGA